ncbi:formimidoylglutamase [Brachybacterium sillae]|uniref:formimidoylglutamase n=1 Tax=Brachybacterium sillae TaxID=2810536 RepID=UPI00217E52F9|nr:formimidoylglutamase [Brachybacterium sillae]
MTLIPTPADLWDGRRDGDGPEHARWHQVVQREEAPDSGSVPAGQHVAVLGFRSDEGVRRNRGRTGAAEGPTALRRALGPLAVHGPVGHREVAIVDRGDVTYEGRDLEGGQAEAAAQITRALDAPGNHLTVVLGGGHETAWASYQGLVASAPVAGGGGGTEGAGARGGRWGVLNLDAHFDLRRADEPSSGTPFAQMADAERAAGRDLHYMVLGIAEPSNTQVLFDEARRLGVRWMTDEECLEAGEAGIRAVIEEFAADLDVLYLTIDLDVLPASVAPGVSAPAALGVPLPLIGAAVRAAAATGRMRLLDVVELNPSVDEADRTARAAARLIDMAVRTVLDAHPAVALTSSAGDPAEAPSLPTPPRNA